MNLRKSFNRPTKEQLNLMMKDAEIILRSCNEIAREQIEKQLKLKTLHDENCLACGATGDDIVTKTIIIDTTHYRVNHCIKCENEWSKYETKKISQTKVLRTALKYLRDIIFQPDQALLKWKSDTAEVFDWSFAETIYKLNKVGDDYMYPELTLSLLRKHYNSVFD